MTVSIPESVKAEGNVIAIVFPAMAGDAPTVAELTAGVNISCYLMPDWDGPSPTQNTGDSRRFCSRQTFTELGRVSWEIAPLVYTYDPQAAPGAEVNKVYDALAPGNTPLLFMGYGLDAAEAVESAAKGDVFPVECGVQGKQARGTDEFAPLTVTQTLAVTGPVSQDIAVAA